MHKDNNLIISIGIVAYNEEEFLPLIFDDINNQDYPHELIEIILVDGKSDDNTRELMYKFKEKNNLFYKISVLDNEKRKQSSGWNIVINNFTGNALVRIDAHARIPFNFISNNARCLYSGENVVGGSRGTISINEDKWSKTLLAAENSMFGSGVASYRRSKTKGRYVSSMFHACYRKEVLQDVGLFNEFLGRTEDNEFHYRIREHGYKLYLSPDIHSDQYIRLNLKKMIKQKYGNGFWIGLTTYISPKCLSLFHYIPFVFIVGIMSCLLLSFISNPYYIFFYLAVYFIFMTINALMAVSKDNKTYTYLLPILFFILHISYGIGTLVGLLNIKFALNNK